MLTCQQHIDTLLRKYLPPLTDNALPTTKAMHYACLNGGKRLRPLLAYCIADLFKGSWATLDPLALAIEIIHCYSLVHDDLPAMDNDDLRRGLPTCHKRFGEANAILAGDALLTLAFEILSQEGIMANASLQCQIIRTLAHKAGTSGMVKGQVLDLSCDQKHFNLNQLIDMHRAKTGALIEAVVQCAAWMCQASAKEEAALNLFAQNLGLAFQIQDDLLDSIGQTNKMGKSQGQDIANNKCTFVTLLGENKTHEFAEKTIKDAVEALTPFGQNARMLHSLAYYVIHRNF